MKGIRHFFLSSFLSFFLSFIYLFTYLFIYLFVCLFIYLFICSSLGLSTSPLTPHYRVQPSLSGRCPFVSTLHLGIQVFTSSSVIPLLDPTIAHLHSGKEFNPSSQGLFYCSHILVSGLSLVY